MKNVDVAWRLIDVRKEWQKLKKMTSMLLSHPGFESVPEWLGFGYCSNRAYNEIKKGLPNLPHCWLKATPQTPETVENPKNWNLRGVTAESEITPS